MRNIYIFVAVTFVLVSCAQMPVSEKSGTEEKSVEVKSAPQANVDNTGKPETAISPAPVPTAVPSAEKKDEKKDGFVLGGHIFMALQNWSRVGATDDSKIGYGLGGTVGLGYRFDDSRFLVGPQFWYNKWEQNYSKKSQSITSSVYVAMKDVGFALLADFDDVFLEIGGGSSGISSAMTVNGQEIAYAYSGDSYTYTAVNLGLKMNPFVLGIGLKNYSGYAKYANHFNFMLGLGF